MVQDTDRLTKGFQLGTAISTILSAPINYSAVIYGFRYAQPGAEIGTITAEVLASTAGTLTGTIDVVTLESPSNLTQRDSVGERPVARLEAGQDLVGRVTTPTTGSIEASITYAYLPGRFVGA